MRKTVDREVIVSVANRMIACLDSDDTETGSIKRMAIIATTNSILLASDTYKGFSYNREPTWVRNEDEFVFDGKNEMPSWLKFENGILYRKVWDDTRIKFN